MKTLIIAIIAAVSLSAFAQDVPATAAERKLKMCTTYGSIAKSIMSMRQRGLPMSELMATKPALESQMIRTIIELAYDKPRYNTEPIKTQTIDDFRNTIEATCFAD